ncbi:DUF58 domain-containing protein [Allorhodopirellula heiligendammensis]|mgnify:CR=1 FL=1|uniref:DUF58 domain-containing protein n=1 Tax=Allorhodopirellula heiligendammensis TaxID=2714739 RepID=A0A5C6C4Y4_9BACT|nr:DUF58 domain-containing protein [Allorhodopirellula heiligendammensis]TWU18394.1 hypothetical protein Poly21_05560 [Allorhodopirellula heiligendammensis]
MMDRRSTRHRLTRLGIQVMLIGVFGILGGSLKGLNLLVVVAAVTLGGLFAQWRVSLAMIDALRIHRRMPAEGFVGKPMRIRYQLHNSHRLMPLWLIRLEDTLQRTSLMSGGGRPTSAAVGQLQHTMTGAGLLMPGQTTSAYFDVTVAYRGRYELNCWRVSSTAPFALSTASREFDGPPDFVDVYPRLLRLRRSWQRILPSQVGSLSAAAHRHGHADDEFFGLREYRHGDSPKHIHWRTTARLNEPAVRQFEQQQRFDLCLLVDVWSDRPITGSPYASGSDPLLIDDAIETAISLAASIAMELTQGGENQVLLVVAGSGLDVVVGGPSVLGRKRMLQSLAHVVPSTSVAVGAALTQAAETAGRLPDLVVISPRSQADAIATDATTATALRQWKTRSQISWVDVTDSGRHDWFGMEET